MLQQAGRLLLLQVDDHVAQRDGHVGEPVVGLADVRQTWRRRSVRNGHITEYRASFCTTGVSGV